MEPIFAQYLAGGLACVGAGLAALGIGLVYATTAPEQSKRLGLGLTGGLGVVCLGIALLRVLR
jgi:hypothetical protein